MTTKQYITENYPDCVSMCWEDIYGDWFLVLHMRCGATIDLDKGKLDIAIKRESKIRKLGIT